MHVVKRISWRAGFVGLAAVLGAVGSLPLLVPSRPVQAAQLAPRSIEMSDASVSGGSIPSGVGSGTNVSYAISFGTSTGYTVKSFIVDFCSESPLFQDTCTAPTGLDLSAATASGGNTSGWTITTSASQVKATDGTGLSGGTTVTLELGGITNPSTLGTFYARIYTYSDTAWGGYASPTNVGSNVDFGGVALSTAKAVSLTARIEESLIFCVSAQAMGGACTGATAPDVTIGHDNGNGTTILDDSQVDTAPVYMQTTTNAASGAAVRMKNNNACGGLSGDGGTTCAIPAAGAAAKAFTAGTADYGVNVADSTSGIGSMDPTPPYDQSSANKYAMDNTSVTSVTSVYGSEIASSAVSGPISNVNNTLTFAAAASSVTPAGIYTAGMALIATGTF